MNISKRDWVQLSAYVDGELNQREKVKLENRIEENPVFQAALEDLKQAKDVLAHTPRVPVPRNFTLRRSQVESQQRRVIPAQGYRLAAAVLSFLFIGVVVVDIGSAALRGGMLASQSPRSEEVMLESEVDEMEEPAMLMAEDALEGEMAPDAEMETMAEAPENYQGVEEGEVGVLEEPQAKSAEEDADRAMDEGEAAALEESQNALSEEDLPEIEATQVPLERDNEWSPEPIRIPWLLILEITLGLGAVGFGIAAWRRRH